ncbi:porin family protein [Vibrio vulnificus]|nr:porin family protein [Vibrio vulnificus]MDS1863751.1 porin family protein [Vibrio vulnificus]HAS6386470.1 outer membrane beta-barrel protein [Vibrio vulnificus]HDY7626083.1 porin family protein [Vibrio vulnificus]HEB2783425.1 porin family protein [Vibrio vulnificus]
MLACSTLLLSQPVFAENMGELPNYFYLGAGTIAFDVSAYGDNSGSELSTPNFTIGFGKNFNEHVAVEGLFRYTQNEVTNSTAGTSLNLDYYQAGVSALLSTGNLGDSPISLFGRLSGLITQANMYDVTNNAVKISEEAGMIFNVGGGLGWDMGQNFWLKAEYVYSFADAGFDDFYDKYSGFQLSIGKQF